jgi:hypothetical protein
MRALLVGAALLAAIPATAGADVRLQGLDASELLFAAGGPDRTLAGDLVVVAGTEHVFGWSVSGGPARRLGKLPGLGEVTNDILDGGGFVRVEAAQPGRWSWCAARAARCRRARAWPGPSRGGRAARGAVRRSGRLWRALGRAGGAQRRPARLRRRAGHRAGLPVRTLAGGRRARVVVRDLAAGNAVVRVLPLPFDGSVAALRFDGPFVGLELRAAPEDPDAEPERPPARALVVFDVRTGGEVTRVPTRGETPWDLGPDGALVLGRYRDPSDRSACLGAPIASRARAGRCGRPAAGRRDLRLSGCGAARRRPAPALPSPPRPAHPRGRPAARRRTGPRARRGRRSARRRRRPPPRRRGPDLP